MHLVSQANMVPVFVDFGVAWHESACSATAADGVTVLCGQALQVPFLNCDLKHIELYVYTRRTSHQNDMDGNVILTINC